MTTELSILPVLQLSGDIESPLPLESSAVHARITGLVALVTISQRFRNPLTSKADLEYLFPLPQDAAVTAFELCVGERTIRASIQEIKQARQQYADARRLGKHASLLEGRRPNLFSLQLANIQPGEFILAVTTYQQRLGLLEGCCEFVFPMGLTPKYHRPDQPDEASGTDAPLTGDVAQVGAVEISVQVETGLPSDDPTSPTHPLIISHPANPKQDPGLLQPRTSQADHVPSSIFLVTLDGVHLPDHDFVLRWRLEGADIQFPSWRTLIERLPVSATQPRALTGMGGYFFATFIPPAPDAAAPSTPREYVFVLDRSGSMSGGPIQQAINALRACLRSLNSQDTYSILLFDDQLEWLTPSTLVTQAAIDLTDVRLGHVDGRGGTEILPALETALSRALDPLRSRQVVFLTDGAVSAEEQILKQVRAIIGAARLFTFGVGPSVNRSFLRQLARIGRGEATFIGANEDIEEAILRFQDRIAFPLLTNVSLRAEGCQIWDVYPEQLPDLYAGQPLEVVGRYATAGASILPASLVVQGERAGVPLEMRSLLATSAPDPAVLMHLWARARVNDLIEQADLGLKPEHAARAEIIALAIDAALLTKYTAFLAVDNDSSVQLGKSHFIRVAHPVPEGLELEGFMEPKAAARMIAQPAPMSSAHYLSSEVNENPLEKLDLSVRTFNLLKRNGFTTVDDAADLLYQYDAGAVIAINGFGKKALEELREKTRKFSPYLPTRASRPASPEVVSEPKPASIDVATILRELVRTQRLDGSWNNDVEITSAALLAFVRRGQTSQKGFYRKQVQRIFEWLAQASAGGFAAFLRALALRELADSTQKQGHISAGEQALADLPAPSDSLQKEVIKMLSAQSIRATPHELVRSLDELRLVVVTRAPCANVVVFLVDHDLGRALVAGLVI